MNGKGKPSTCYSDNPKMGKPYRSQAKGYAEGGYVPEEEPMPEPEAPKPRVVELGATELKPTKLGNKRDLFKYKKES